ncbi:MAG: TRAM domain-containing protein, partial [Notoacmeibacter sp.]
EVLIEKPGREAGQWIGRSPWLIPVVLPQNNGNIGEIVSVRIGEAGRNTLNAEGLEQSAAIKALRSLKR